MMEPNLRAKNRVGVNIDISCRKISKFHYAKGHRLRSVETPENRLSVSYLRFLDAILTSVILKF